MRGDRGVDTPELRVWNPKMYTGCGGLTDGVYTRDGPPSMSYLLFVSYDHSIGMTVPSIAAALTVGQALELD